MGKIRTTLVLDETAVRTVMERYGLRTKTEAVNFALHYVAGQPMTREEALAMRGSQPRLEVPGDQAPPEFAWKKPAP
jgi:Arc/MetJ family transcription regulator